LIGDVIANRDDATIRHAGSVIKLKSSWLFVRCAAGDENQKQLV